jgi:anthranilate synthase component 1
MTLQEFQALAATYNVIPVHHEVLFDTNTAVTAYAKIKDGPFSFLLESVVGGETWARYTFLGSAPREVIRVRSGTIESWRRAEGWVEVRANADPLTYLEHRLTELRVAPVPGLPRFFGGAVGYLSYDVVRYVEHLPDAPPDDLQLPEAVLMFTDTIIAIDNLYGKAMIIALAFIEGEREVESAYADALDRIDQVVNRLGVAVALPPLAAADRQSVGPPASLTSSYQQADFERDVERVREYIRAGDAFQVVLSQRLEVPFTAQPLEAYRVLRSLNPSPYLYLLELDTLALVGSSPEVLVRVEDKRVVVKPIAGTRRRGATEEADAALAAELLADEKERAEHLMLVDLGRNDVGRVARYGTVEVRGFMQVERYSHVLHIVTQVEGELRDGISVIDVFRACFPAGTVTGAPKVRAMQIIDELEPVRRGPYAGAVGYFGYGGQNMDTAIGIRTLIAANGIAYVQAGAGIVADSVPHLEWEETLAKARAVLAAVAVAVAVAGSEAGRGRGAG